MRNVKDRRNSLFLVAGGVGCVKPDFSMKLVFLTFHDRHLLGTDDIELRRSWYGSLQNSWYNSL